MRASGVLMHISSLCGDYSIGSLGKNAEMFIDFLSDCGFSYWQTLPLCMPDEFNSPYKSFSAFSLNPMFIDLEVLEEKGYITKEDLTKAKQFSPYTCEFDRLNSERYELLAKASKNAPEKEIAKLISSHPHIRHFCEFMALRSANNDTHWRDWTVKEYDKDVLLMWQFTQYEFFSQWLHIKEYSNKKGIMLIGDMPMFVSDDSSDVYYNKEQFLLDKDNYPSCVAGVPPDYFAKDGQLWGNPHYDWDRMEKNGFKWWRERFEHTLTLFDGVRIDHFRGLEAYYSIPYGEKTAHNGKWVKAKGREMLDSVKELTDGKFIIAEDLGEITEEVEELVKHSGFPGIRVLQFGFISKEDSIHRCHNYPKNCVAYTGTHDNNTLLGFVWEMPEEMRSFMLAYCGYKGHFDACYSSLIGTLFKSHADTVILPIQDILLFGGDTRMNVPGRAKENWGYRLTRENLLSIDRKYWESLNNLYSR